MRKVTQHEKENRAWKLGIRKIVFLEDSKASLDEELQSGEPSQGSETTIALLRESHSPWTKFLLSNTQFTEYLSIKETLVPVKLEF